jgi:uncharacterized protein (DUF58 family)
MVSCFGVDKVVSKILKRVVLLLAIRNIKPVVVLIPVVAGPGVLAILGELIDAIEAAPPLLLVLGVLTDAGGLHEEVGTVGLEEVRVHGVPALHLVIPSGVVLQVPFRVVERAE